MSYFKEPSIAITAIARKLAALYWKLFVKGANFVEKGIQDYQEKTPAQQAKKRLKNGQRNWNAN